MGMIEASDRLLTGWGHTSPTRARVYRPTQVDELAWLLAQPTPRGVIARGLGRSYGDPAQNAGGVVLDLTRLQRVHGIDLVRHIVNVDAGLSLDEMMRLFVPLGMFVPVTPGTRFVTVGGAIASDIHGKNHHLDGSFGDHVLDFDLLSSEGAIQTISRDDDPETFRVTLGGMGLTGFVTRATIQMIPIETSYVTVDTERAPDLDTLMARMSESDEDYRYSVAWVDTMASGRQMGRGVLYQGNHTSLSELGSRDRSEALRFNPPPTLSAPRGLPSGLINPLTVRGFNELWFRRHPKLEEGARQRLWSFFHQLDMVHDSNRMYGPDGFVQHQFVVPDSESHVVREAIERLSARNCPSFLVVLKRMGPGHGMLSFPISGWTLAVDIPTGWDDLASFLDELDDLVAVANGRIYLAKDARMRPERLPQMYPELDEWRQVADRLDPQRRLRSDLGRRLHVRSES